MEDGLYLWKNFLPNYSREFDNYSLLITFDNGELRKYEMLNQLTGVFSILKDKDKFNHVFINRVGNAAWNIDDKKALHFFVAQL